MNYSYNENNLLDEPQTYMYTAFQGPELLEAYFQNRNSVLSTIRKCITKKSDQNRTLLELVFRAVKDTLMAEPSGLAGSFCSRLDHEFQSRKASNVDPKNALDALTNSKKEFSLEHTIDTAALLRALIATLLASSRFDDEKQWLDKLVQRFEVTKKLYETYLPGFRKGQGSKLSIELYWLFSLLLCLYYAKTERIKYLSTLIKVCDLLTSLPMTRLSEVVSASGMELVVVSELVFVKRLAQKKEVSFASN